MPTPTVLWDFQFKSPLRCSCHLKKLFCIGFARDWTNAGRLCTDWNIGWRLQRISSPRPCAQPKSAGIRKYKRLRREVNAIGTMPRKPRIVPPNPSRLALQSWCARLEHDLYIGLHTAERVAICLPSSMCRFVPNVVIHGIFLSLKFLSYSFRRALSGCVKSTPRYSSHRRGKRVQQVLALTATLSYDGSWMARCRRFCHNSAI